MPEGAKCNMWEVGPGMHKGDMYSCMALKSDNWGTGGCCGELTSHSANSNQYMGTRRNGVKGCRHVCDVETDVPGVFLWRRSALVEAWRRCQWLYLRTTSRGAGNTRCVGASEQKKDVLKPGSHVGRLAD